jgi:hypothetical protein
MSRAQKPPSDDYSSSGKVETDYSCTGTSLWSRRHASALSSPPDPSKPRKPDRRRPLNILIYDMEEGLAKLKKGPRNEKNVRDIEAKTRFLTRLYKQREAQ